MRGEIPLSYPEFSVQAANSSTLKNRNDKRLVLLIGEGSSHMRVLCEMLDLFNCQAFLVSSDVQALEVAPALPFSVIIVAATQARGNSHAVIRRLIQLMDDKTMPEVPLWSLSNSESAGDIKTLRDLGASEVLPAPVKPENLAQLCKNLPPPDIGFWSELDPKLEEFPAALVAKLPEMQKEFLSQIRIVYESLTPVPRTPAALSIIHDVHAVKSAALALGYMRIAVLMANLEHILAGRQVENAAENLSLIADCLRGVQLS